MRKIYFAHKNYTQVSLTSTRFLAIKIIDSNVKKLTRTLLHLFSSLDYERDPVYEKNTTQLSHFIHKSLYKCILHISEPCTNCFFFKYSSRLTAQRSNIYINFSKWHSKFLGVYCDGFGAVVSFVDSN